MIVAFIFAFPSYRNSEFVAPTQENLSQTPFIVPNSPTGQENELGADEPMDTSMPPEDQSDGKEEEPMDMDPAPKSHPSASTPVSQNSPGLCWRGPSLCLPSLSSLMMYLSQPRAKRLEAVA
ncbi:TP53-binding protein 1-like [Oncorhynchus kisutch]|uniref:TP53-binding protein 1-like n=1 Tax=Oncorhynchus kisutch TaxID=8019 RepID=UPI0012DF2249|nr:TP53-binding protein 1-like [Oncorhynchus kisutch]